MSACPYCQQEIVAPPEPPEGAWVRDKYGAVSHRRGGAWGLPGMMYLASWSAMWAARGPLVECEPWGQR